MEFRRDINGLRAYAVLAVMLYHFGIAGIEGGFIGVDVFFVLSGFLMTSIILRGIEQRNFSILAFYASRARRIVPALTMVCLVLLAVGWLLLTPSDLRMLSKHISAAISFTSNFTFKDEEGYFDAPSQTKWLLHSWSLAVEWQFYLLYPLILAAVAAYKPRNMRAIRMVVWVCFGVSLLASIATSWRDPTTAFYMLHTRIWQLCAGGLVALYAPKLLMPNVTTRWIAALGWSMMALAATTYSSQTPWPGYAALLPVMGAVLILIADRQYSPLIANRVADALGRWSYSIYLWHWPLVVALGYYQLRAEPLWLITGIGASILLGYASYTWIEQPTRRYFAGHRPWRMLGIAIAAMAGIAVLAVILKQTSHWPQRVPEAVIRIDAERDNRFQGLPKGCGFDRKTGVVTPCDLAAGEPIRWILWGDSHAGSIVGAVAVARGSHGRYYSHQCATMFYTELNSKGSTNRCTDYTAEVARQIDTLPHHVPLIIVNRYAANLMGANESKEPAKGFTYTDRGEEQFHKDPFVLYHERLVDSLCQLAKTRTVYAVKPIPEIGVDVPATLARRVMAGLPPSDITISRDSYQARNRVPLAALEEAHTRCGVRLLDPIPYLCDATDCFGSRNGVPYYFDDDHLSETGSHLLLPLFKQLRQ